MPEPAQRSSWGEQSTIQHSPPPSATDENTVAERYVAHFTDVSVPRSTVMSNALDIVSQGRHRCPPAQVCGGHPQPCP